jgi:hypothetical protein
MYDIIEESVSTKVEQTKMVVILLA